MSFSQLTAAWKFRLFYLAALALVFFAINGSVRLLLPVAFPEMLPLSTGMISSFVIGLVNDFAALTFVMLLPATLILLPTDKFLKRPTGKIYCISILFITFALFTFGAFAEYLFWDEFGTRFNFIAVDYLIYTTEVTRNMVESYPLGWLFSAVFLFATGTTALAWKYTQRHVRHSQNASPEKNSSKTTWKTRLLALSGLYMAAAMIFALFVPLAGNPNKYWNEYAKNGVYELFSAYRHNQLDYRAFYKTIDTGEAFTIVQSDITDADKTVAPSKGENLLRVVAASAPEHTPNVIIVLMESMGSNLLGENTPNLNALASQGLSFSNMRSTGTRTVRGIEAVMLSIPPTPGNSIVRRPDNGELFNLGSVFRQKGYDLSFIYGGVGYFDNMNAFFSGNGYRVVDKLDFAPANKTFATAWGQCDADLYAESLSQADKSFATGKPFQQVLLTTSNHRPFSYPEGKVSIAPGTSRKGAVQYSDYAIGNFIQEAKTKPWFDNTIFLFVGDHPSSIAGKTEVPADAYGIVSIMYGPRFFAPEEVKTLCSQIDVAPTLLAALGWEYTSQFFGTNARIIPYKDGRAWISTYQLLGFRTNDQLLVLKPNGSAEISSLAPSNENGIGQLSALSGEQLLAKTVAYYQCAYDLFVHKKLKESVVATYSSKRAGKRQAVANIPNVCSTSHNNDSAAEKINQTIFPRLFILGATKR